MFRLTLVARVALAIAVAALALVAGCSSSGTSSMYFNVSQRGTWSTGGQLAFASLGGNSLLYIYSITDTGGDARLLTPSNNDPAILNEGGWQPSYSPDGTLIAFVSRRGPTPLLYLMDATNGEATSLTAVTTDTGVGADSQPSWKPGGTGLIYTSTRRAGVNDIRTIDTNGANLVQLITDGFDYQWASYRPTDANVIVLQSDRDASNADDTDIFAYTISPTSFSKIADSTYSDGGPAWSPDGTKIAFHSNRAGDYDIWVWDTTQGPGPTNPFHLTADARSDGYPFWNADGTRIGFSRDYELWSVLATDGSDPQQITRRFR